MSITERNLRESFRLVKNDMMQLQRKMTELAQNQEKIVELFARAQKAPSKAKPKKVQRAAPKRTRYLSSKTGTKFHVESCPFAKNIKPKSRVYYQSKTKPLNEGLKPCKCVN